MSASAAILCGHDLGGICSSAKFYAWYRIRTDIYAILKFLSGKKKNKRFSTKTIQCVELRGSVVKYEQR